MHADPKGGVSTFPISGNRAYNAVDFQRQTKAASPATLNVKIRIMYIDLVLNLR